MLQGVVAASIHKRREVVRYDYIRGYITFDIVLRIGCVADLLDCCPNKGNNRIKKIITLPGRRVIM